MIAPPPNKREWFTTGGIGNTCSLASATADPYFLLEDFNGKLGSFGRTMTSRHIQFEYSPRSVIRESLTFSLRLLRKLMVAFVG
jgi:hypothetical protein